MARASEPGWRRAEDKVNTPSRPLAAGLDCIAPLFVPGHRPELLAKAARSGADAVIIDLEDAVPAEAKDAARAALRRDVAGLPVLVRINPPGTPWHAADLRAVTALARAHPLPAGPVPAGPPLAGLVLPKASAAGLGPAFPCPVIALVETAEGLDTARELARAPGIARLAFGSVDYCADLGCAHSRVALLHARSHLVVVSRLAGLPAPLDGVTLALDDAAACLDDARHAAELGFGGKLCIHPRQIAPVLEGFTPAAADIAWARRVMRAPPGASVLEGAMIDPPVRARAAAILRRADPPPSGPGTGEAAAGRT
jgi:citrate lyase subunit beta/citryl-CoA lyase